MYFFFCNFVQINLLKLFLLVAVFVVIIVVNAIYYISIKAVYNLAFWYEPSENAAFSLTQTLLSISFFSSAHVKYGGSYVFAWSFLSLCRFYSILFSVCFFSIDAFKYRTITKWLQGYGIWKEHKWKPYELPRHLLVTPTQHLKNLSTQMKRCHLHTFILHSNDDVKHLAHLNRW